MSRPGTVTMSLTAAKLGMGWMARLLDILALWMLILAVIALGAGVYLMGNRDDLSAIFLLVIGVVLLRSAVDLLRPRSSE